jgi:hypothetical protein
MTSEEEAASLAFFVLTDDCAPGCSVTTTVSVMVTNTSGEEVGVIVSCVTTMFSTVPLVVIV